MGKGELSCQSPVVDAKNIANHQNIMYSGDVRNSTNSVHMVPDPMHSKPVHNKAPAKY